MACLRVVWPYWCTPSYTKVRMSHMREEANYKDFSAPESTDCELSLFSQSCISSAGLERANWPRGKLCFARFSRSRDHPEGLLAVYRVNKRQTPRLLYRKRERRKCIFNLKILVFIQSSPSPWSPESGYICAGRNGMITTRVSMKTFTGLKPLLFILTTALVDRSRHIKTRPAICRSVHWRVSLVLLSKTRLTIWLSWCWYRSPLPANERVFRKALQKKSSFENHLRVFDDFTSHLRSVFWRSLVK